MPGVRVRLGCRLAWDLSGHAHRSGDAVPGVRREAVRVGVFWAARSKRAPSRCMRTTPRDFATDVPSHGRRPALRRRAGDGDDGRAAAGGIDAAKARQRDAGVRAAVLLMSPQGERLDDAAGERAGEAAGPGVARRALRGRRRAPGRGAVDREISIGDYVTLGRRVAGDGADRLPVRRLPGSLNDAESAPQDSFSDGLLDWPHYTRPEEWKDARVPDVLLSGNHAAIARWRRKQALGRTWVAGRISSRS